jgi:hypothetical protein
MEAAMRLIVSLPLIAMLFWPSGLCFCQCQESHGDGEQEESRDHRPCPADDHERGCPASKLAVTRSPSSVSKPNAETSLAILVPVLGAAQASLEPDCSDDLPVRPAPSTPLYLILRALRN